MSDLTCSTLDKLKALIAINNRINTNYGNSEELLVSILESAMSLVRCEASSLLLVKKEDGTLRFEIALGPKGAEVKSIPVEKNSIAGWVCENNQSIIVNDVLNDPRFNSKVQKKTLYITHNMIAVPMSIKNECVGVIELINKANNENFIQDDLELLELIGSEAAIAYENSSKYNQKNEQLDVLQNAVNAGKDYHSFIAKNPVILSMLKNIDEAASTNSSVLITGESGAGKELFAEQVHLRSNRSQKPFVRVSCAALSPSLLESELFGHVKGAFTDASSNRKGRFELADGGTIFLDEIGELPLNLQAKLLRVLQEKKFERVGSSETISVDVRIIAATNRDLEQMVQDKEFRSDLFFRLNVLPLNIPPLRNRVDEIPSLSQLFLSKYSKETHKDFKGFNEDAEKAMLKYKWPGNIRELENIVERACIIGHPPYIQLMDLRLPVSVNQDEEAGLCKVKAIVDDIDRLPDRSLKGAVNLFKKRYVTDILEECNWNQTKAAQILGIQRTYVSKLLQELEIKR